MELIAHRAGNLAETLPAAIAVADTVELDVHLFRGRLEVRHGKVLWPFARLWERWELLPHDSPRPGLHEILAAVDAAAPGAHLWFDLKGCSPRLTMRVLREAGERRPLTMSARSWWVLWPAIRVDGARVMWSVGARWQRRLARHLRRVAPGDGIVIHERLVTSAWLDAVRATAATVIVWAVDDLARAVELDAMGVDGVILDDLDLVATLRCRRSDRT